MLITAASSKTAPGKAESPWKAGDLRGLFPDPVSPELFRRIGLAVGTLLTQPARILVMGDYRLSTPILQEALIEGLLATGATVLDGGQGPTPVAYLASAELQTDAVLIVTASHNPAAYNGLKLIFGTMPPSLAELEMVRRTTEQGDFRQGDGGRIPFDPLPLYMRRIAARWGRLDPERCPGLVVDTGNGAWSSAAPRLLRERGFAPECLSCIPDGTFPDRPSDCSRTGNLTALRAAVLRRKNSIGIAWDGDGDRAAFLDEDGEHVTTDEISMLLARAALAKRAAEAGGSTSIVLDLKLSDVVRRDVEAHGGIAVLERTGHTFMRRRMISDGALLGLDACGHYFFHELGGGDDGLWSALSLLELLSETGEPLRLIRRRLPNVFSTPELRISTESLAYQEAVRQLQRAFPAARTLALDGHRFILPEGLVLVRESGTEPVLSLRIEGFDQESYQRLLAAATHVLPELGDALASVSRVSEPANE